MSLKVSVVIPIYNVENYLPQCLDSLVSQTLKDVEIICVNDGSTDRSADILSEYAAKYENIKIITQNNCGGVGGTRNVGVKAATGEYIAYVDGDDFVKPDFCEIMYNAAKKSDADMAITDFYIYKQNDGETYPYRDMIFFHRTSLLGKIDAKDFPNIILNFGCWDKIYRKRFLIDNNITFPEKRIYEDFKYSYDALTRANGIAVVKDRLYYYRKNTGKSITDREIKNDNFKFDFLTNYEEIEREWRDRPDFEKYYREPIITLLIRDGYFHNSNIKNRSNFKKFFLKMQCLITEADLKTVEKSQRKELVDYAKFILSGDLRKCRKALLYK